ncbi:MAG: pyridoxal phosphate-dependent aminotransferase [Micavibrio sp.]
MEKHEGGACCQFMRPVLDDIRQNPGAEIVRYARRVPDVLSLASGETDSSTPDFITQEVNAALGAGKTFYGPILGHNELRREIAAYHQRIYNVTLPQERVIVTSSGTSAIHLSLLSTVEKGDEVVAIFPLWKNLLGAIRLQEAGVRGVDLKLNADGTKWSLDLDELFAAVTPKTRAIVINTPNNPTGWVMPEAQMRIVLDFARARGLWIISDEVYGRLTYDMPRAPSFLDVATAEDRLFIVNSFSKNWAMTGWRLGWLIGPAVAEPRIYDLVLYDNMGPPNFTQFGALAALQKGEAFIADQKKRFQDNEILVHETLQRIGGIEAVRPESSFYTFFKSEREPDCMAFARRLIDEHALGLAPGCAFGRNFNGYMRMCYAVSTPRLIEALDRLEKSLTG